MISNLFYAFGKQEELQSRIKGQIAKKWLQVRSRGLSIFGRGGLKNTCIVSRTRVLFCSRAYDFAPENWIIGFRFSLWKLRRLDKHDIHPIRYLIWLLVFSVLFARNISE